MNTEGWPPEFVATFPNIAAGFSYAQNWHGGAPDKPSAESAVSDDTGNPLKEYFESHKTGRGLWKWRHYFDIYHRYFKKFIGREVRVLEIGIYSGGSLDMWRNYFGAGCQIFGVDVQPACKAYEGGNVKVFIGDQADRAFWKTFRDEVGQLDIIIDDGGHTPQQQIVTLEETLPLLRAGGIYLCEDVHHPHNGFAAYVSGLISHFNITGLTAAADLTAIPTEFQRAIYGIHSYPFLLLLERAELPVDHFVAPKHGTEWQPFLDKKRGDASPS